MADDDVLLFWQRPARADRRLVGVVAWLAATLSALFALGAEDSKEVSPFGGHRAVLAEGRELIVLGVSAGAEGVAGRRDGTPAFAAFAAESYEIGSRRIHVVAYDGETYRAAAPKEGPRSRIVFDPERRRFRSLLPSIRVELDGNVAVETVAEALGARRATRFDSLGFAVFDLPSDLHPAEAVARVREMPGAPAAAVRLRRPRIDWK
ncbi:MAG: hypothetical protein OXU77_22240 [Gammaproteobacteria bacterium]|nr:hypothetical protein [Gammaproteobacteria bacterium]MDE0442670.1 hypothetical protein [Gammaproteobacteria bacterium]